VLVLTVGGKILAYSAVVLVYISLLYCGMYLHSDFLNTMYIYIYKYYSFYIICASSGLIYRY